MDDKETTNAPDDYERRVIVLKFRDAFDKRGLTQKAVAEKTGIRPNAISALARGYVDRLTLDHVERIAAALDIDDLTELVELMPEGEARQYEYGRKDDDN